MSTTVLVTGANRGIGLEFVREYLSRGFEVFAACRSSSAELDATGANIIAGVDVSDTSCIDILQRAVADNLIDILINNAGILRSEEINTLDYATMSEQFNVNTLGPLRVFDALKGNLAAGSKVALITSRMGSVADNGSGGYYGYRMSKAALNAAGKSLANDLREREVAVAILHPGFVQTEMVGNAGDISAETAAKSLSERIDKLTMQNTGTFWHSNGEILPW